MIITLALFHYADLRFGIIAFDYADLTISKVELSSISPLAKSYIQKQLKERTSDSRMSEKNVAMRNAVIVLSVVCAIALISIPVIFVYHNSIFQLKDQEINRLSGVVNQKDSQIGDLQNQIKSQIAAAGTNNQVQVSGTIQPRDDEVTSVEFVSLNSTIKTSVPVVNGEYSVLLVGGQSYDVRFTVKHYNTYYDTYSYYVAYTSSLYVPLGVTTFTADFS